jgi:type II secretory pathway pseudopilin PulG
MTSPRRLAGEEGVTLAELLTVMAVLSVVMGFITATVVNALGAQRRQTAQVTALNDAKLAFERVTRDIRAADPLRVAALDLVRLDVRDPTGTLRTRTYSRDGDQLVVTEAATGQTRSLVSDVAADQPLFLFHLADGSTVMGEGTVDPRSVRSVTVQLRVEPEETGRVVDLQNRVLLRNSES